MIGKIIPFIILFLMGGPVFAFSSQELFNYIASQEFAAEFPSYFQEKTKHECPPDADDSDFTFRPVGYQIFMPLRFLSGNAHPDIGAWQVDFLVNKCGYQKIITLSFKARFSSSGLAPVLVQSSVPGESRIYDRHTSENVKKAVAALRSQKNDPCSEHHHAVHNTIIINSGVNSWTEQWLMAGCGLHFNIMVLFHKTQKGGIDFKLI